VQLRWELGSPMFGLLLRKYAPHDTYEVRPRPCPGGCVQEWHGLCMYLDGKATRAGTHDGSPPNQINFLPEGGGPVCFCRTMRQCAFESAAKLCQPGCALTLPCTLGAACKPLAVHSGPSAARAHADTLSSRMHTPYFMWERGTRACTHPIRSHAHALSGLMHTPGQVWKRGTRACTHPIRSHAHALLGLMHAPGQVWKRGTRMRVDGSLMGIDDKSGALIPEWKRGHFSLLFDGATAPATVLLLDHRKQTIVDLQAEKRRHRPDLETEARCRSRPSTCGPCDGAAPKRSPEYP
jgi:hypothetical protein